MALAFSEAAREKLDEIVSRYPNRRAALLPALRLAQLEFGHTSAEVMEYVGELLGVPPVKVRQVATFYTMYNKKPVGRFHLQVCTNLSCWLVGGVDVRDHLFKRLGVSNHGTTGDDLFTVEEVECLAACGTAPVIQVNDREDKEVPIRYHEHLDTPEKVDALLDALKAKGNGG